MFVGMSCCFVNYDHVLYNTGGQFDSGISQPPKPTDLLLLCEQSADHQVALLSVAMETSNTFLPVVAASLQVHL